MPQAGGPAGVAISVPWREIVPAVQHSAAVFGAVLVVLTAIIGVIAGLGLPEGHRGDLGVWLSTAIVLIGLALGGTAETVVTAGGEFGGRGVMELRFVPLLITAALLVPVAVLAFRQERRRPAAGPALRWVRAGAHGLAMALLVGVAGALGSVSNPYGMTEDSEGVTVEAGLSVVLTLVVALLVTTLVSAAARFAAVPGGPRTQPYRDALRLLATPLVVLASVAAIGGLVLVGVGVAQDADDFGSNPAAVGAAVAGVLNLLPVGVLMLLGVPVTAGVDGGATGAAAALGRFLDDVPAGPVRYGLLNDPSWWSLAVLVPLILTVVVAVRFTLRRPVWLWEPRVSPGALARTAGFAVLGCLLLAAIGRATLSVSMRGEAIGAAGPGAAGLAGYAGPSFAGALLAGLVWGLALAAVLRLVPSVALLAPGLARGLAGRVDESWRPVLDGFVPPPAGTLRRRWVGLAGAAVAVVVLLGVGAAVVVRIASTTVFGPGPAAVAYLEAVGRGDATAARAMFAEPPAASGLLTDAVLKSPGVVRPVGVTEKSTEVTDDSATVTLDYTVAEAKQSLTVRLTPVAGESRYGVFDVWKIASAPAQVDAGYEEPLPVTVAGVAVEPGADLAAFPGRYPIAVADPTGMYAATRTELLVAGAPVEAAAATNLSAQGRTAVQKAVDASLDECARSTAPSNYGCPFDLYDVPASVFATAVQYTIVARPVVDVVLGDYGIQVRTVTQGRVSYSADRMFEGGQQTGEITFDADGSARIDDGVVTVVFD
jgi:uncharacterized membrane protein YqgA involved in biofilm formation